MMTENYHNILLSIGDSKFQFTVDGSTAFIDYRQTGKHLVLLHTEVPEELQGRGVAAALVERTLMYAEENDLKVTPKCTYVIAFLKKHPEWERVIEK